MIQGSATVKVAGTHVQIQKIFSSWGSPALDQGQGGSDNVLPFQDLYPGISRGFGHPAPALNTGKFLFYGNIVHGGES